MSVSGNEVLQVSTFQWSGHCRFPANGPGDPTAAAAESHARCRRNGPVYNRATGLYTACGCGCHLGEEFECSCGYLIREAPVLGLDEDGDPRYVHIDGNGNAYSIECP